MSAFLPQHLSAFYSTICILAGVIGIGYFIAKIRNYKVAKTLAWLLVLIATAGIERLMKEENGGYRMLSIILVMLFSIKCIVTVESYKDKKGGLSFIQWLAFTSGWFGMRPQLFESLGVTSLPGGRSLIFFGISRILIGLGLMMAAKWIAIHYDDYFSKIIFSGLLLAGISFILHFGLLNVCAGGWRFLGADTRTLFRSPFQSTSLTEFWGKRWNIAFSEMTSIAIYRPLKIPMGITSATIAAFLFSGFLHEMAISVPVKTGFGLPLLYFFIHGLLMMAERGMEKKGLGIGRIKWLGRCWVLCCLLLPLPLLFHKAFIKEIVWPIIGL